MTTAELNRRFGSSAVSFSDGPDGVPLLKVSNKKAEVEIALYGGQVMSFLPHGQMPVLWNGAEHEIQPDTALRGGIPICFPWFAGNRPGEDFSIFPFHGFARLSVWEVVQADDSGIVLSLPPREGFDVRVHLRVQVAEKLKVVLSVENTGMEPFRFEAAFHSYFAVSDIRTVSIEGLDDCSYLDATDQMNPCRQQGLVTFNQRTDRIYTGVVNDCVVRDLAAARAIRIQKNGTRTAVVWNPWDETIAEDTVHFGSEEYRGMVCVETANICDDAVTLAPGACHNLTLWVSVE